MAYEPSPAMEAALYDIPFQSVKKFRVELLGGIAALLVDPAFHADWLELAKTIPMTQAEADARMEKGAYQWPKEKTVADTLYRVREEH